MIGAFALGVALGMALGICLARDAMESELRRIGLLRAGKGSAGEAELRWCAAVMSDSLARFLTGDSKN
jgi:hypothetical protein